MTTVACLMTRSTTTELHPSAGPGTLFNVFTPLVLFGALLLDLELPGQPPPYARPVSATRPRYFEWLESNTQVIYPALAILVISLIALAVISALRTEDMDALQKAELTREIVQQLRREIHGVTVNQLAKTLGVPRLKVGRLLEDLQTQGITECRTDSRRHTTWRLKGLIG